MLRTPSFSLPDSVLLRPCVDDDGFDWDMIDHGQHRVGEFDAELSELHAVEADVASAITEAEAAEVLAENPEYPEWSSRCLGVRGVTPTLARQVAVIVVRQAIGRAHLALRQSCLDPPRPADRLYLAYPAMFNRLTSDDRLLPLTADAFGGIDPHRDGDLLTADGELLALDPSVDVAVRRASMSSGGAAPPDLLRAGVVTGRSRCLCSRRSAEDPGSPRGARHNASALHAR